MNDVFATTSGGDHSTYVATLVKESAGAQTSPTFTNSGGSITFFGWALSVKAAAEEEESSSGSAGGYYAKTPFFRLASEINKPRKKVLPSAEEIFAGVDK